MSRRVPGGQKGMCLHRYASTQLDHAADLRLFMEALPHSTQRWFVIGLEPPADGASVPDRSQRNNGE